jgi:pimeloyl-ACP methyl ester carboxylesterase
VKQIPVDVNVRLEVLDFGGSGRPIIFLAGMGLDGHEFDDFAPMFLPNHRVLAISRRGFGKSSAPTPDQENYSADRLGKDVLAVMTALKIDRPVLVGHSLAGEELSSIATGYPQEVSGLIYLEAGYPYALYPPTLGDPIIDAKDLQQHLDLLFSATLQTRSDFDGVVMLKPSKLAMTANPHLYKVFSWTAAAVLIVAITSCCGAVQRAGRS